jgi:hypothetical protein
MRIYIMLSALCFLFAGLPVRAESAYDVVMQSDMQMRGDSSYAELTMRIIRPDWTRSMSMKSWSKEMDFSLVLVTEPARERGSASLKRYREMWNWVPGIERIIKIAPSMLSQSWMGSDFTNDDLINQSSVVVDYTHQMVKEETFDGEPVYVIDATAKPDAPVVWSRLRLWISKANYLQRKVEFFDEFDELVNRMQTFDIKQLGGRAVATRLEMIPADEPGNKTELIYHQAQYDFAIETEFFSLSQMQSLRE